MHQPDPSLARPRSGLRRCALTTALIGASIAVGDVVLVIQMQGAQIDSTNTSSYGDGAATATASG